MTTLPKIKQKYQVGGAIDCHHPTYITREADRELLAGIKAGEFCCVLSSFHAGKSSLRLATVELLKAENYVCIALDLNPVNQHLVSIEDWYDGVILELETIFDLCKQSTDLWWRQQEDLSPVERLIVFIEDLLLVNVKNPKIVIFIDGVDNYPSINSPIDDLWALIQYCYGERKEKPEFNRLTFVLLGTGIPSDLMEIGKGIELTNFEWKQVIPLMKGLEGKVENPEAAMGEILYWTEGQPFLTQKLCQLIANYVGDGFLGEGEETESGEADLVADLVKICVIENWESQDRPEHLIRIRDRLLNNRHNPRNLLKLYQQILNPPLELKLQHSELNGVGIIPDNSPEQQELLRIGLVGNKGGILKVNNPIYEAVFNEKWVKQELEKFAQVLQFTRGQSAVNSQQIQNGNLTDKSPSASLANFPFSQEKSMVGQAETGKNKLLGHSGAETAKLEKARNRIKIAVGGLIGVSLIVVAVVAWATKIFTDTQQQLQQTQSQLSQAEKQLQEAQEGTKLERQGINALQQFELAEIEALLSAMRAGQELKEIVKGDRPLSEYPAVSPLFALQQIIHNIHERNQLKNIKHIAFSPDGKILGAVGSDGSAKLLELSGKAIAELKGHRGIVLDITFSPDGKRIATAAEDGTAKIWDISGKAIAELKGHEGSLWDIAFSPDSQRLATAGEDGTARIWDLSGKQQALLKNHQGRVLDVAFSADGKRLATAGWDGTTRIWSTRSGKQLARLRGHEGSVERVTFSPDSQRLATAGWDGTVRIWSRSGKLLAKLKGHDGGVWNVSFSPDGKRLATAGEDGSAHIWNISGEQIAKLQGHQGIVTSVSFSQDGQRLATAGSDGTVRVWELNGKLLVELRGHQGRVWEAIFSKSNFLATTGEDGTARIWQLSKQPLTELKGDRAMFANVSFSPNSKLIATAGVDGSARIWDVSGKALSRFRGFLGMFGDISFSPDGQRIATAGDDSPPRLWKISGEELVSLDGHEGRVQRVNFSPNGELVATAGEDGIARLWNVSGEPLAQLQGHESAVWDVSFSPDGELVATAGEDGTARVWNSGGQQLMELGGDRGRLESVSFSPDGQLLAVGGADGVVRFWDVWEGAIAPPFRELRVHRGSVVRIAFSADGERLATRSDNGMVRVWDVSGRAIAEFEGSKGLSLDGELLATLEGDELLLWEVKDLDELLAAGCEWLEDYFVSHPERLAGLEVCGRSR